MISRPETSGVRISCPHCDWAATFTVGQGMRYARLENVIDLIQQSERAHVRDLLEHHEVPATEYGHRIFACPNCPALQGGFYYQISYDQGEVLESVCKCRRCKARMAEVDSDISRHACPGCGKRGLSGELIFDWD